MTEIKKLTKTEQYVHLLSNLADLDCVNHEDLMLLTEIKERLEQHEPDKIIDGIKYCGRCLVGVGKAPPDEELVEDEGEGTIYQKLRNICAYARSWALHGSAPDEWIDDVYEEIRTILQSRQPGKPRFFEIEIDVLIAKILQAVDPVGLLILELKSKGIRVAK